MTTAPWSQPISIYLDTADWSYLESGKAASVERTLRQLGASGRACFLVSREHLAEFSVLNMTRGFRQGFWRRIAYVRSFPGAILLEPTGQDLHSVAARSFACQCLDVDPPVRSFAWRGLADMTLAQLSYVAAAHRLWNLHNKLSADRARSEAEARPRRKGHGTIRRLVRSGNKQRARDWLIDRGKLGPGWRGRAQLRAFDILRRMEPWAKSKGIQTAIHVDESFENNVGRKLPLSVRRSKEALEILTNVWSDESNRARMSPALACLAALDTLALSAEADPKKFGSFEADRMHALFAPLSQVFTADRRNARVLQPVMAQANWPTKVLRTNQLDDVAHVAAELASGAVSTPR